MKPSIGAVVLHLQVYYYTYHLSFAEADWESCCFCMYLEPLLFILSIHLEQAMAKTAKKKRLHKTFQNSEAVWVFIRLTETLLTEEAVGWTWFSCGCASLPSFPRRGWIARGSGGPARPDVRKRAGCAWVGWCPIWRKRSPKSDPSGWPCVPSSTRDLCQKARERRSIWWATKPVYKWVW